MKAKIIEILREYSRKKAGYIPLEDREELAEEIIGAVATSFTVCSTHTNNTSTKIVKEVEFEDETTVGEIMKGVYY